MPRRCSQCNTNGHYNRTCPTKTSGGGGSEGGGGGVRLFGVRLTDGSMVKKSASMVNLPRYNSPRAESIDGYQSDDPDRGFVASRRRPIYRKKGTPWTEEEHRQFLLGLHNLGKGNWRGISKNYCPSRTPTQIASHAQKYFLRHTSANRKKKRNSLFDIMPDIETNPSTEEQVSVPAPAVVTDYEMPVLTPSRETDMNNPPPSLDLSLKPAFTPFPFQLWPPNAYSLDDGAGTSNDEILRSVQVVPQAPLKEAVGMSQLTLEERDTMEVESSQFSLSITAKP